MILITKGITYMKNTKLICRHPNIKDKTIFLNSMQKSKNFHDPFVQPPVTEEDFDKYLERYAADDHKSYLVLSETQGVQSLVGVINISNIIRGCFLSGYLGYYATAEHAGSGKMSQGLQLVLSEAFDKLKLHRLEANIQPDNYKSIDFVKRNGFKQEGFSPNYLKINGKWCDHERWAIVSEGQI